jgi:uncharacterized membrane protein
MKLILLSTFITSIFFLIIDILWLSYSVKSFYKPHLGDLLTEKPVMWAAILFYLIYVIGLAIVVLQPAINKDSVKHAFLMGAVFGIVAYGTYNFTNMATIKNWSPYVVFVDTFWGGILTATSSSLGIYLAKKILI